MNFLQRGGPVMTLLLAVMVLVVPSGVEKAVASISVLSSSQSSGTSQESQASQPDKSSQSSGTLQENNTSQPDSSSQSGGSLQENIASQPDSAAESQMSAAGPPLSPSPDSPENNADNAGEKDSWNLILVNDWNTLPEDFTVALVKIAGGEQVDYRIQEPLERMIADAQAQGVSLMVCSGYRDVAYQTTLYDRKTAQYQAAGLSLEEAREAAKHWVARPGSSEHHTGLAVDIVTPAYQVLDAGFAGTPAAVWLAEHCGEYGFILRYPQEKEELTGVVWEPWHFRYVGTEAAGEICESGICLEEFLAQ